MRKRGGVVAVIWLDERAARHMRVKLDPVKLTCPRLRWWRWRCGWKFHATIEHLRVLCRGVIVCTRAQGAVSLQMRGK